MPNCYLFYKNNSGSNTAALARSTTHARKTFKNVYYVPEKNYHSVSPAIKDSDICVFTHGPPYPIPEKRGIWVNTWHGFPFKRMGMLDKFEKNSLGFHPSRFSIFDYWLSYGNAYEARMTRMLGIESFLRAGVPRIDFFRHFKKMESRKRKILFMPSFRTSNYRRDGNVNDFLIFFQKLNATLSSDINWRNKVEISVKLHTNENINIKEELLNYGNIKTITRINRNDFYEEINGYDFLITDYSSVWVDALFTRINIAFFQPDEKTYRATRGFISDSEIVELKPYTINFIEDLKNIDAFTLPTAQRENFRDRYADTVKKVGENCKAFWQELALASNNN